MSINPPRYFIGLALPEEISDRLFQLKWQLHEDIDHSLKPLVPHITLLHPSNLESISPEEIIPKIRRVASPYLPLSFSYEAIEQFENRVLYIRVHSPELQKLQNELLRLLPSGTQIFSHQKTFIPHITLVQISIPHVLDSKNLKARIHQEIPLSSINSVDILTCFTQIRPREYRPSEI